MVRMIELDTGNPDLNSLLLPEIMRQDEEDLLNRVKQSENKAFQILFERYYAMLFRTTYYRLGDERLAQDIVQETFLKVWVNRDRLKPHLAFFAYLVKLSKNLVLDHYKREEVRTRHHDHVRFISERPHRDPEQDLSKHALEDRIREVVNTNLPEKCRAVFLLSRIEGLSNQEIADTLNVSKKTVENQLYRALKILRKKCSGYL